DQLIDRRQVRQAHRGILAAARPVLQQSGELDPRLAPQLLKLSRRRPHSALTRPSLTIHLLPRGIGTSRQGRFVGSVLAAGSSKSTRVFTARITSSSHPL